MSKILRLILYYLFRCYWDDSLHLMVVMGTGFLLSPGDAMALKAQAIKSANSNQANVLSEVVVMFCSIHCICMTKMTSR